MKAESLKDGTNVTQLLIVEKTLSILYEAQRSAIFSRQSQRTLIWKRSTL